MRLNRPVAVALGIARAVPVALHAQNHDTVWVWNARCYDPTVIAILVHLDGRPVYRSTMPICRWERRFEKGRASFRFTPQRPLVWYGYRSDEGDSTPDVGDTTAANTPFEIDLWQAGGETDAIELGFQALARDGLHMNSIHFVWPTKPGATTMAPGLVLETWPEPRPSHGDAGGQQASRPETFEGTYVLDTTGLAPLPFFTPGLIPGEGTTLRSASFVLKADSRFLAEIVAVYTDSAPAEVHITGVGTWKVRGDSLALNCRWSHSVWKTTEDIRSSALVTPSGITIPKLWHLDAGLFHREGALHFVRFP